MFVNMRKIKRFKAPFVEIKQKYMFFKGKPASYPAWRYSIFGQGAREVILIDSEDDHLDFDQ